MKLLLTSGGIRNESIRRALLGLLSKPLEECNALVVPTGMYASGGLQAAGRLITGRSVNPMTELGWASLGVLELSALASAPRRTWVPQVDAADVLLVGGGDTLFLAYWMRESGLDELLPSLQAVYVGLSAGSMVLTPEVGPEFMEWRAPSGDTSPLGLVDFAIFPHLDHPDFEENSLAMAQKWAAESIQVPAYAIDDQTAIRVVDGQVDVVSEGSWHYFER